MDEAIKILKAIKDEDFKYLITIIPSIEYRGDNFTKVEHYTQWDDYADYTRYISPAINILKNKCIEKVILLISGF